MLLDYDAKPKTPSKHTRIFHNAFTLMLLIYLIDFVFIAGLIRIHSNKGLEGTLPFATFGLVLLPPSAIISLGPVTISPQRVIILVLALLYAMRPAKSKNRHALILAVLMGLNLGWNLLSAFNSVVPDASIKKALSQVADYYLLYFIYVKAISKTQTIHKILMAMVAAMAVCSIFGAIEAYQGWTIMKLFPSVEQMFGTSGGMAFDADRGLRAQSTFAHPILFGAALAMGITAAVYLLTVTNNKQRKRFLWLAILLMFVNIYKTISRGPWMAVGVGLILMGVLGWRQMRRPMRVILTLVVAVLVIRPGVWDSVAGIYYNSLDSNTVLYASYQYRYALRDAAIAALSRDSGRALWGYGPESFYSLHLRGVFGGKEHVFLSCDSAWIAAMLETGYLGLLLFAGMLLIPLLKSFYDYCKLPRRDCYLSLFFFTNFLMYYFLMASVAMYSWGQNGYMLWIIIAATVVCRAVSAAESPGNAAKVRRNRYRYSVSSVPSGYLTTAAKPCGGLGAVDPLLYSNAPRSQVARVLPS
jgi:O-Antigen ligase